MRRWPWRPRSGRRRTEIDRIATELGVSTAGAVALSLLVLLQVVLALLALIDLTRRRHVANFPKWLWAIIILFGSMIGPILYFAIGRSAQTPVWEPPDDVDVETVASRQQQIRRAVDDLYDDER